MKKISTHIYNELMDRLIKDTVAQKIKWENIRNAILYNRDNLPLKAMTLRKFLLIQDLTSETILFEKSYYTLIDNIYIYYFCFFTHDKKEKKRLFIQDHIDSSILPLEPSEENQSFQERLTNAINYTVNEKKEELRQPDINDLEDTIKKIFTSLEL